jgi:hypothetical protein
MVDWSEVFVAKRLEHALLFVLTEHISCVDSQNRNYRFDDTHRATLS